MLAGRFLWVSSFKDGFSWFKVGFHGQGEFLSFFMVPDVVSWFLQFSGRFFPIPGWLFIIPGSFFKIPGFFMVFPGYSLVSIWADGQRTFWTPQKVPAWSVSWPHDPACWACFGLVKQTINRLRTGRFIHLQERPCCDGAAPSSIGRILLCQSFENKLIFLHR